MPLICPACHTENRDSAMFCHGCARKLPTFTPTQPSILETMRATQPPRPRPAVTVAVPMQFEPRPLRALWIGVSLAVLALVLGIGAWLVHLMRQPVPVPARAVHAERSASPSAPPVAGKPAAPAEPVSIDASLAPGEAEVAPGRPAAAVPPATPPSPVPPMAAMPPAASLAEGRQPPRAPAPPRVTALDPRSGCETLNFVFAARCEAAHCDKPQYARHPRCNLVREERRRDEARRNPTLGF